MTRYSRSISALGVFGAVFVIGVWIEVWIDQARDGPPLAAFIFQLPWVAAMVAPFILLIALTYRDQGREPSSRGKPATPWMLIAALLMVAICLPLYFRFAESELSTAGLLAGVANLLSWLLLAAGRLLALGSYGSRASSSG